MKKWMRYAGGLALSLILLLLFAACTEPAETSPEPEAGQEQVETTGPESTGQETDGAEKAAPEAEETSWAEESLSMLQNVMAQEGTLCGAAYIGPADDYAKSEGYPLIQYYAETYPFVADIPRERWVQAEGEEMYCVVPCADCACLTVSQFVLDEDTGKGTPGETLYESRGGEPIILIGNVSDIVPGFLVTVTAEDGSELTYSPCLSLKDGALNVPEKGVYDFTLYNYEGPGSMAPFLPEKLIGDWVSYEVYDGEGKQYNMSLRFHEDGTMECWYNEPMGAVILHCEGYYYEANGVGEAGQTGEDNVYQYEVTATGGTAYDASVPDASLHGAFAVDMWDEGDSIALLHRDGDPLFTGYERENDISLVFSRVVD